MLADIASSLRSGGQRQSNPPMTLLAPTEERETEDDMTHTPGPWSARDRAISNRLVMMANDCVEVVNETGSAVAYLYKENWGQNGMDAANARLIAAAPALLEALEAFVGFNYEGSPPSEEAQIKAERAIAFAKGEQQ